MKKFFKIDKDSIKVGGFSLHVEHPWSHCVKDPIILNGKTYPPEDVPRRIYVFTPFVDINIALYNPTTKTWDTTQKWSRKLGYTYEFGFITFHPNKKYLCDVLYCGRLRRHKGSHGPNTELIPKMIRNRKTK